MSGDDGRDPFDDLVLDEGFIEAAPVREASARARVNQSRFRAADRQEAAGQRRHRARARRRRWRRRLGTVAVVAVGAAIAVAMIRDQQTATEVAGLGWAGEGTAAEIYASANRPTPAKATSSDPLGVPADPDAAGTSYQFMYTQEGSDDPVAYDPCRPIRYVVNDELAPAGSRVLVEQAIAEVSAITGLQFEYEGSTDEVATSDREPFQEDRYGDRWAPVHIAWATPEQVPDLAGRVAGVGGSQAVSVPGTDQLVYVTGIVHLDGPGGELILARDDGQAQLRDVIVHELGHLVGLDHVADPQQLMYPEGQPDVAGPQDGDIAGLTRLGQGACFDEL